MINTVFALVMLVFTSSGIANASTLTHFKHPQTLDYVFNLIEKKYIYQDKNQDELNLKKIFFETLKVFEEEIPEFIVDNISRKQICIKKNDLFKIIKIDKLQHFNDLKIVIYEILQFISFETKLNQSYEDLEFKIIKNILKQLDSHSLFLNSLRSKTIQENTNGEFAGIGIEIKIFNNIPIVINVLRTSPASKADIKKFDQILDIDGQLTIGLPVEEIVNKLRGDLNTAISLIIRRNNELFPKIIELTRSRIKHNLVSGKILDNKIGYLKINSFYKNVSNDVKIVLENFEKKSNNQLLGLILDLRDNSGGLLEESILIANLFLENEVIVITKEKFKKELFAKKANPNFLKTKLPLIVLINSGSASASEVVSGALKNNNRALLIGRKTFGKGSIQTIHNLPNKSALKLTIAHYLTPENQSIQSIGIVPDILTMPINLNSRKHIAIFPKNGIREYDLKRNFFNSDITIKQNPFFCINYLLNFNSISVDFDVYLANCILTKIKNIDKKQMLTNIKELLQQVQQEENKKIWSRMIDLDIDWSMPKLISNMDNSQLELKIVSNSIEKFKNIVKIKLQVENIGSSPIFQLYGISSSENLFLENRDLVFGRIDPGKKRIITIEFKVFKNNFNYNDLIKIVFMANKGKICKILYIPISVPIYLDSVLIYRYTYNSDGLLRVQIKNRNKFPQSLELSIKDKEDICSKIFIKRGYQRIKFLDSEEIKEIMFIFSNHQNIKYDKYCENEKIKAQLEIYNPISNELMKENLFISNDIKSIEKNFPSIDWLPSTMGSGHDNGYKFVLKIFGNLYLKDLYLSVNGKKLLHQSLNKNDLNKFKSFLFNQFIKLEPGLNFVKFIIRSSDSSITEKNLVICK